MKGVFIFFFLCLLMTGAYAQGQTESDKANLMAGVTPYPSLEAKFSSYPKVKDFPEHKEGEIDDYQKACFKWIDEHYDEYVQYQEDRAMHYLNEEKRLSSEKKLN